MPMLQRIRSAPGPCAPKQTWIRLVLLVLLLIIVPFAHAADTKGKKTSKKPARRKDPVKVDLAAAAGGPSSQQPDHCLETWTAGPASALRAEGWQVARLADQSLTKIEAHRNTSLEHQLGAINQTYLLNARLDRLSEALTCWSEPAGNDLALRATALWKRLYDLTEAAQEQPACAKAIAKYRPVFFKKYDALKPEIAELAKRAKQGAELDIYQRVVEIYDEIFAELAWYPNEPAVLFRELVILNAEVRKAKRLDDLQVAQEQINKSRQARQPDFASQIEFLEYSVAALKSGKAIHLKGESADGPQVIQAALEKLPAQSLAGLQRWAIDLSLKNVWLKHVPGTPQEVQVDETEYNKFRTTIVRLLAQVIEADTATIATADVLPHYQAYLQCLGPFVSRFPRSISTSGIRAALDALARKDPALAAQVSAYESATHPILLWRSRLAASKASAARSRLQPLEEKVFDGECREPIQQLMENLIEKLEGKGLVARDLVTMNGQKAVSGVDSQKRYCVVELKAGTDRPQSLRADLLLDQGQPPLSLDAAVALAANERGDLLEAGGVVQTLYLESVTPLYMEAERKLGGLPLLLDALPAAQSANELRLRMQLEPRWLHSSFDFVDLESSGDLSVVR